MIIKDIVVGPNQTNCYILGCQKTKEALIIDPGADGPRIKKTASELGVTLKFIINTHGHADHIAANRDLNLPVMIHQLDADFLTDPRKNLSILIGFPITSPPAVRLLRDKDEIHIGNLVLNVIHTPGHTPGSISIKADSVLFTGDTLFAGGVGRTDLPNSDETALISSIKDKLFLLDDDTPIYPGHGESSTIGQEKESNLWKN